MERQLQEKSHQRVRSPYLSVTFATFCIVDLFGVFPLIALSRPIIDCGWLGIPMVFAVFGAQIYTAILLGQSWTIAENLSPEIHEKKRYPYQALAELALGQTAGKLLAAFLEITIFGSGVPNLLIAAQNMQLIVLKMSDEQVDISFCYWLVILGALLCPIMWLGSPKDMKWLALLSVVSVFSVAFLIWYCILEDPNQEPVVRKDVSWEKIAIAYGIIAFQFDIHPTVLSIQMDMDQRSNIAQPILAGFLVTGSLFIMTMSFAEQKYGSGVNYNILQSLPSSGALYVAIILVSTQIFLSMAIGTNAFFQDVEDKLGIPSEFNYKRVILRSGLVMVLVVLGEAVPRFDLVMGLIGGCLTGPLMFIFPPIIHHNLLVMKNRRFNTHNQRDLTIVETSRLLDGDKEYMQRNVNTGWGWTGSTGMMVCGPLVTVGITATILSTYFSISSTILYAELTPSCMMNFTVASHLLD